MVGGRDRAGHGACGCELRGDGGVCVTPIILPSHMPAKTAYVCERTCVRVHVHAAMDLQPAVHWPNIVSSNGTWCTPQDFGWVLNFIKLSTVISPSARRAVSTVNSTNKTNLSNRSSKR